jgi:hypothetical protein
MLGEYPPAQRHAGHRAHHSSCVSLLQPLLKTRSKTVQGLSRGALWFLFPVTLSVTKALPGFSIRKKANRGWFRHAKARGVIVEIIQPVVFSLKALQQRVTPT